MLGVTVATVSRHLSILSSAGLIRQRKQGRWILYRIAENLDEKTRELLWWIIENVQGSKEMEKDWKNLESMKALGPENVCRKQRGAKCCPEK
ncbi:MAG: ArsR family transcriptional regulator [Candidatus Wallbacteria bacterium]|nr:ArsR family transcriptional regulator [Candidatus Wallbacteria bacterium]